MTTTGLMTQTEARQLARLLSEGTGLAHVAHTMPQGCWGGCERGWAVTGPAVGTELEIEQDRMRAHLIELARARLRQAERAQDRAAEVEHLCQLDRLGYRALESL